MPCKLPLFSGFRWHGAAGGILVGHDVGQEIGGEIAGHVGAVALGLYGIYLIARALRTATQEELERSIAGQSSGCPCR